MHLADEVITTEQPVIGADAHIVDTLGRLSPKRATGFVARQMKSVLQLPVVRGGDVFG